MGWDKTSKLITITDTQSFMGIEIPVVLGGFGKYNKCICDKTIAEIHSIQSKHVRELINRNILRFLLNVDVLDLKVVVQNDDNLLTDLGYTNMEIAKAERIYLLSERGYAKLIKIMDSDLAWEIHDKLIDDYFKLREERKDSNNQVKEMENATKIARLTLKSMSKAGSSPQEQLKAIQSIYSTIGIDIPFDQTKAVEPKNTSISKKQIAKLFIDTLRLLLQGNYYTVSTESINKLDDKHILGYHDNKYFYLYPQYTYDTIANHMETPINEHFTKNSMLGALATFDHIKKQSGRNTVKKTICGEDSRFLVLDKSVI